MLTSVCILKAAKWRYSQEIEAVPEICDFFVGKQATQANILDKKPRMQSQRREVNKQFIGMSGIALCGTSPRLCSLECVIQRPLSLECECSGDFSGNPSVCVPAALIKAFRMCSLSLCSGEYVFRT